MRTTLFHKTLLALAITASSLPIQAQEIELAGNALLLGGPHTTDLTINGGLDRTEDQFTAMTFLALDLSQSLLVNTAITLQGQRVRGLFLDDNGATNRITQDLTHQGVMTLSGDNAQAIAIVEAIIGGNLSNQGTLSITGTGAEGLAIAGTKLTTLGGDLRNEAGGKILVSGDGSKALTVKSAEITGNLSNHGLLSADGKNARAVEIDSTRATPTRLNAIENSGTLIATGEGAIGLNLKKLELTGANNHISNTGTIHGQDTAIHISADAVKDSQVLHIVNSGSLSAGNIAVNAAQMPAAKQVDLHLNDGSQVRGHLQGLNDLRMTGNVQFFGNTDIVMATNKTVHLGHATQAGHLSLEQAHTKIDGDLDITTGSSLTVNMSDATEAGRGILHVTQKAHLDQDSSIKVKVSAGAFTTQGLTHTLVSATTLDNRGVDVGLAEPSALLQINHQVDNNNLVATAALKSETEIANMLEPHGASRDTQQALVRLAHDGVLAVLKNTDGIYRAFAHADEQELAALAQQLTPDVDGGASRAATTGQAMISASTTNRTAAVRGLSSGDTAARTGVWMQSLYSDATQSQRDGIAGYNAYSRGIAVGADGKVNEQVTLGLAYSLLETDVNGQRGSKTRVDSHAFTLYGGFEQGNYFADASLTYGLNDNEGERTIASTTAKADYDSRLLGLNLVGGYTYPINPHLLVEPRVAARYSLVDIDGYREKGSSAALKIEDQRFEALELGAGLRVAGRIPLGKGTLEPQIKVMAYHDFAADQASSTSTYVLGSTPFVTTGAKAVRNTYEAGIGADYKLGAVTVGLNYDYVGKSGFDADTFTAKVRYDF